MIKYNKLLNIKIELTWKLHLDVEPQAYHVRQKPHFPNCFMGKLNVKFKRCVWMPAWRAVLHQLGEAGDMVPIVLIQTVLMRTDQKHNLEDKVDEATILLKDHCGQIFDEQTQH